MSKTEAVIPVSHAEPQPHRPRYKAILFSVLCGLYFGWRLVSSYPPKLANKAVLIKVQHGAVAAENQRCSELGVRVLEAGGNAVDAAISATLCMGVVNPFASGIGGGGFMTVRIPPEEPGASSKVYTIDFRETAPALANKTMFSQDPTSSMFGGLAVGVPGELRGLEAAHKRWGTVAWKSLVEPAASLAAGWNIDAELGKRMAWVAPLLLSPDWAPVFAPHGRLLKEGETIRWTNYSKTLHAVANRGADALYTGSIADALARKVRETGGILTAQDLKDYSVNIQPALEGSFRGKKVYTSHAPTSGPALLHMLNLMEKFNATQRTGLNTHRLVEILKFGFAARSRICDPAFNNDTQRIEEIPTKQFSDIIFPNITDNTTHPPGYYHPVFDVPVDHGTSHLSVIDRNGMAVAITSTVNFLFGSFVIDPVTGVILNNEMADFSIPAELNAFDLQPSPYNYPEPGKRPLSSTAPTIMEHEDGSFYLAIGGSGGTRIFGSIFQAIINLDWGLNPSEAVEFARLHDRLVSTTEIDRPYPECLVNALRSRGHNVTIATQDIATSEVQVVTRVNGTIYAASDSRKNGIAAGY